MHFIKAAKAVAIQDDQVLCIIYNRPGLEGFLDLPGGKIDYSETIREACARKFHEETGLEAANLRIVGKVINASPETFFNLDICLTETVTGTPHHPNPNEQAVWMSLSEIRQHPKRLPLLRLLDEDLLPRLLDTFTEKLVYSCISDENHRIISEEIG